MAKIEREMIIKANTEDLEANLKKARKLYGDVAKEVAKGDKAAQDKARAAAREVHDATKKVKLAQAQKTLDEQRLALMRRTEGLALRVIEGELTAAKANRERLAIQRRFQGVVRKVISDTNKHHDVLKEMPHIMHRAVGEAWELSDAVEGGTARLEELVGTFPVIKVQAQKVVKEVDKLGKELDEAVTKAKALHIRRRETIEAQAATGKIDEEERKQRLLAELQRQWEVLRVTMKKYDQQAGKTKEGMARINEEVLKAAERYNRLRVQMEKARKNMNDQEKAGEKLERRLHAINKAAYNQQARAGEALLKKRTNDIQHQKQVVATLEQKYRALTRVMDRMKNSLSPRDFNKLTAAITKTGNELDRARRKMQRMQKTTRTTGQRMKDFFGKLGRARGNLIGLAFAIPGLMLGLRQLGRAFREISDEVTNFDTMMGQVHTLVPITSQATRALEKDIIRLSRRIAKPPADIAKGLYFVISAGVRDTAEAMEVLEAATEVGAAGLADTQTTVDALTTIINAYGMEASEADRITDLFFRTVEQGKLTFSELAAGIGVVASSASVARVDIEELLAMVASITAAGFDVAETTISLDRLITSIVSATPEAKAFANALGIDLSQAALDAKGIMGVLNEVLAQTGGEAEKLIKVFPQVRARRIVLPFQAAGVRAHYAAALESMTEASGAAETALVRMNERLETQWKLIKNRLLVDWQELVKVWLAARNAVVGFLFPLTELDKILNRLDNRDFNVEPFERARSILDIDYELLRERMRLREASREAVLRGPLVDPFIETVKEAARHGDWRELEAAGGPLERARERAEAAHKELEAFTEEYAEALAVLGRESEREPGRGLWWLRIFRSPEQRMLDIEGQKHADVIRRTYPDLIRTAEGLLETAENEETWANSILRVIELLKERERLLHGLEAEELVAEEVPQAPSDPTHVRIGGTDVDPTTGTMMEIERLADRWEATAKRFREAREDLAIKPSLEARQALEAAKQELGAIWHMVDQLGNPLGAAEHTLGRFRDTFTQDLNMLAGDLQKLIEETELEPSDKLSWFRLLMGEERITLDGLLVPMHLLADAYEASLQDMQDANIAERIFDVEGAEENAEEMKQTVIDVMRSLRMQLAAGIDLDEGVEWGLLLEFLRAAWQEAGLAAEQFDEFWDAASRPRPVVDSLEEIIKRWKALIQALKDVARGTAKILDGFGLLSEENRKVIDGLIGIIEGWAEIRALRMAGESVSFTSAAAPVIGAVVGLGTILSTLFKDNAEERRKEHRDYVSAMRRLQNAMEQLAKAMEATADPDQVEADRQFLLDLNRRRFGPGGQLVPERGIDIADLTREELKRLEEIAGDQWDKIIEDSKLSFDELVALLSGLPKRFGVFGDDLAGALAGVQYWFGVLGDEALTASQKMELLIAAIAKYAPQIADMFRGKSLPEQRKLMQEWAKILALGTDAEREALLRSLGLTAEQLQQIIDAGLGIADADATSRSVQIARSITEIQAVEVIAWLEEIAMTLRSMLDIMIGGAGNVPFTAPMLGVGAGMTPSLRASRALAGAGNNVFSVGDVVLQPDMTEVEFEKIWEWMGRRVYLSGRDPGSLRL